MSLSLRITAKSLRSEVELRVNDLYSAIFNETVCPYLVFGEIDGDIGIIADGVDQQTYNAISVLAESHAYLRNCREDYGDYFTGFLESLYVYPDYRRRGIGTFLKNNLGNMIEYHFNVNLRCLVTLPVSKLPGYDEYDELEFRNIDDSSEKESMLKAKQHSLSKAGFKKVNKKKEYFVQYYTK